MSSKVFLQGEKLEILGKTIEKNVDNFMIDTDGKLFTKCQECSEWHLITKMEFHYS